MNKIELSIICPAFNEEAIIEKNLSIIYKYLQENISPKYLWEIIVINDGSKDNTGQLADNFAKDHENTKVIHHFVNMNLANALKTGFTSAKGTYIITLDLDLSYDTYHILNIFNTIIDKNADIVIASPYMKGGKSTAVPFTRKIMSRWVNRFMRLAAQEKFHTYTGMVRGYRSEFLQCLNLKTKDYEINSEILYKAMILRAKIIEIPAHLDWTEQNKLGETRTSGMRILKSFFSGLMASFIFRPYIYFIGFGLTSLFTAFYIIGWMFLNIFKINSSKFSDGVAMVYEQSPHAFIVGGITLVVALIFLGIGFLSLQNKRYFEESFHLGSSILKQLKFDAKRNSGS